MSERSNITKAKEFLQNQESSGYQLYRGPYVSKREFSRYIDVCFSYEGFHRYEDAPDKVAFLRHSHRHVFHVKCRIEVFHDDRELEFFMAMDDIRTKVTNYMDTGNLGSCEQQAEYIANGILNLYGEHRDVTVSVSEDGENAGVVKWRKP